MLVARHAVAVSTGSAAFSPTSRACGRAPWTSREATSVKEVPARLAIIGGGVVAAEMATAYAAFGTQVTLISRGGLLAGMEPFAGERVAAALREQGVDVRLGTEPVRVSRGESGVTVETSAGATIRPRSARRHRPRPAHRDLGLETVGLTPGGWLDIDDTLRVPGFDWLYAVGDVNHRALLTHQGKYQARAAGDVIAARANGTAVSDRVGRARRDRRPRRGAAGRVHRPGGRRGRAHG